MKHASFFPLCSLLASIALGCSGSGFDEGGGDNQDQSAELESGKFFSIAVTTKDGCGSDLGSIPVLSPIDVQVAPDGRSMTWKVDDSDDGVTCAATKLAGSFECQLKQTIDVANARVLLDSKITLDAGSADRMDGEFSTSTGCVGAGCTAIAIDVPGGFPCVSKGTQTLVRSMPAKFVPTVGAYNATVGKPASTTCDAAPAVAERQKLRIEVDGKGKAKVFADSDPVPHECEFEGNGRTVCTRLTVRDNIESTSAVDVAWTSAGSFEGTAFLQLNCAEGEDCSGSALGELPCDASYRISGVAAK